MKKTATVLFVILGLSIIAAMIGISTSEMNGQMKIFHLL